MWILPWVFLLLHCQPSSVPLDQYVGGWSGKMSDKKAFSFDLSLEKNQKGQFTIAITGQHTRRRAQMSYDPAGGIHTARIRESLIFKVKETAEAPVCFLQSGHQLSSIEWKSTGPGAWEAKWNLLLGVAIDPTFYLSFDSLGNDRFGAFGFFKSPQCHYLNCGDFSSKGKEIRFRDANSGFVFTGELVDTDRIELEMAFLEESVTIPLRRMDYDDWAIGRHKPARLSYSGLPVDGLDTESPYAARLDTNVLAEMSAAILSQDLASTHSVLIGHQDRLVFEEYYYGFDRNIPHDTRSAGKSFASAMVGAAIDDGLLSGVGELTMPYFEEYRSQINWGPRKDSITIRHLPAMSSGLDADDSRPDSYANEGAYQSTGDWTQHILEATMIHSPGAAFNYGSANPHRLGPVLDKIIDEPVEFYLHEKLFEPLGMSGYRLQTDDAGRPCFGGGWYVRPIDLLKFGLLYLNTGRWEGEQLLSSTWVKESLSTQQVLSNRDSIGYGYLWWKHFYEKDGKMVVSFEARGAGGQYVFAVPQYDLVAVVTSGNYRNGLTRQPERIMEEYILRAVVR